MSLLTLRLTGTKKFISMFKAAQPKPPPRKVGRKRHTKKTVSTNAIFTKYKPARSMFKKLEKDGRDMDQIARMKLDIERANAISRTKGYKVEKSSKQRKRKQQPGSSLATAFPDATEVSRDQIQATANAGIESARQALTARLNDFDVAFSELEQELFKANEASLEPFKNTELAWTSTDETHTGKTTLSQRMKKFLKTLELEEKELKLTQEEWDGVHDELMKFVVETYGAKVIKAWDDGAMDPEEFVSEEHRATRELIEAERKQFLEQIEEACMAGLKQMKDGEKKLQRKQKKVLDGLMGVMGDDDDL